MAVKKDWIPCTNPDGVVREVKEKRVISREETEETKEMEDIQHLGDITDEVRINKVFNYSINCIKLLKPEKEIPS